MPTRAKPSRSSAKSKSSKVTRVVAEKRSARPAKRKAAKPAVHRSSAHRAQTPAPAKVAVPTAARPEPAPVPAPAPTPTTPFQKALKFLQTLTDYERLRIVRYNQQNFDLDRMRHLLKKLGNPETQFRSIHVAGTKGKGSTCAMTAAMLEACGYKVGLYTSPHLIDIRERIQVNGEMISQEDFAHIAKSLEPIVAKMKPMPTYFDVITAIAFKYFADQGVNYAVVETGLGGRLDSTNVLTPEVTAITSISKDHMAQLGNTVEKIAEEKAGIFKPGVPAVTILQEPGVEAVLKRVAERVGSPLDIAGKTIEFSYRFESTRPLGPQNRVCLTTPYSKFEHLLVPLMGEHQAVNCGLALSIIDRLKAKGVAIDDSKIIEGLAKTHIAGRMELLNTKPRIVVDGAHNAASIDATMRAIGQHVPYDSLIVIFACCGDKDVSGMLEKISNGADKVIFTRVESVRSADPEELASRYTELYGKMAQVAPNLREALAIAKRAVTKEDLICVTGSFYLVGEAKRMFPGDAKPE